MVVPNQTRDVEDPLDDTTTNESEQKPSGGNRISEWLFAILVFWPLGLAALGMLGLADNLSGLPDAVLFGPWLGALAGVFVLAGLDEIKRKGRVTIGRAVTAILAFAFAIYLIRELF